MLRRTSFTPVPRPFDRQKWRGRARRVRLRITKLNPLRLVTLKGQLTSLRQSPVRSVKYRRLLSCKRADLRL